MSAIDDILANLPLDDLAAQLGEDPAAVRSAVETALPALLGGLQANAQDPGAADSLAQAVQQHDNDLGNGPIDLSQIDASEGAKIAGHIFGNNQEQVISQLGGVGGNVSGGLIQKLLPMLAPVVLAYLAKQVGSKAGAGGLASAAGGGIIGTVLNEVLKGATQGSQPSGAGTPSAGSIITDVLGGLLGGGKR